MIKRLTLFILIFLQIALCERAFAEYYRDVSFDWDVIEGATSYEVEIKIDSSEQAQSYKTQEAVWSGKLKPGKYTMRLRAKDYRKVPGAWSDWSEFNVKLESANIISPTNNTVIKSNSETEQDIAFKWKSVPGSSKYLFILESEDGKIQISQELSKNEYAMKLPVASKYTWKVSAIDPENNTSDGTAIANFSVFGKQLEQPKVSKPESSFVRELKWSKSEYAENYDAFLYKYDRTLKKWSRIKAYEKTQTDNIPFEAELSGGKYQLLVKANGRMRPTSSTNKIIFDVKDGDRSPATEYTALVKKSIDRVTGWYGIASYLVTQVKYSGKNSEKNSASDYDAIGGTGRVGVGWFQSENPWGFLTIIDLSGFSISGKTSTYASSEANVVRRFNIGERSELRLQGGISYRELPETIGDPLTSSYQNSSIKYIGPHAGIEYWLSVSPYLGLQFNAHIYRSLFKVATPNGQSLIPTSSHQIGVLGSYRFTPTFTGLCGLARRTDTISYQAIQNNLSTGSENTAEISGNYLNFFAEWSF